MRFRLGALAATAALVAGGVGAAGVLGSQNTVSTYVDTTGSGAGAFTAYTDWTAPTASASVIAKTAGGDVGYVHPGGTYYAYANVTDTGNPAAGIASVNATVSPSPPRPTTAPLTAGTWTVGGVAYNRRTASLTVKAAAANGTASYGLVSVDSASPANSGTQTYATTTVDGTAPTATAITSSNVAGGVNGRPELGDTVTYTASEPLDVESVLAGWTGASSDVIAAIYYDSASGQDQLLVGSTGSVQSPIGAVALGRTDYVPTTGNPVYFGQTGTRSKLVRAGSAITLTLGTPSATASTAASTGNLRWTPTTGVTDRAGNPLSASPITEAGAADKDF